MISKDEALKMAIEVFDMYGNKLNSAFADEAYQACKEALEQPAQKPEAYIVNYEPNIQWQALTDDEISKLWCTDHASYLEFAHSIEQALKDKNHE